MQPILIKPVPFMMAQLALAATLLWHDPLAMQDVPCSYGRLSLPCTTWCFHLHNGLKITSDSLKREHYLPGKGKKKHRTFPERNAPDQAARTCPRHLQLPMTRLPAKETQSCKAKHRRQSMRAKDKNWNTSDIARKPSLSTETVLIIRNHKHQRRKHQRRKHGPSSSRRSRRSWLPGWDKRCGCNGSGNSPGIYMSKPTSNRTSIE